jgi:tRNA(fMet)-specific endonuclease VapC
MILLDPDHLSLLQARDAPAAFALQARLEAFSPDEVVTTVITMEEQMRGWLALIHRVTDAQRQVAY